MNGFGWCDTDTFEKISYRMAFDGLYFMYQEHVWGFWAFLYGKSKYT